MVRKLLCALGALTLLVWLLAPIPAMAHESITLGDYTIEYGWLTEPPIAGQPNGLVINIANAGAAAHDDGTSPTIEFVSPVDDAEVGTHDVEVAVEITGADASQHWHLYADDTLVEMLPIDTPEYHIESLTAGAHTLKVQVADAEHNPIGLPASIHVTAVEGAATDSGASTEHAHDEASEEIDISQFVVEIVYGGKTQTLTLEPAGHDAPGQYVAHVTPTRAGQYTVRFGGQLGGAAVNAEVQPEEVVQSDPNAFPEPAVAISDLKSSVEAAAAAAAAARTLAVAGIVVGAVGLVAAAAALVRRR